MAPASGDDPPDGKSYRESDSPDTVQTNKDRLNSQYDVFDGDVEVRGCEQAGSDMLESEERRSHGATELAGTARPRTRTHNRDSGGLLMKAMSPSSNIALSP